MPRQRHSCFGYLGSDEPTELEINGDSFSPKFIARGGPFDLYISVDCSFIEGRPMRPSEAPAEAGQADIRSAVFLRMPTVIRVTGLGRSTIYRLIAERKFPSPVKLAGRAVGWRSTDIDQWSDARPTTAH